MGPSKNILAVAKAYFLTRLNVPSRRKRRKETVTLGFLRTCRWTPVWYRRRARSWSSASLTFSSKPLTLSNTVFLRTMVQPATRGWGVSLAISMLMLAKVAISLSELRRESGFIQAVRNWQGGLGSVRRGRISLWKLGGIEKTESKKTRYWPKACLAPKFRSAEMLCRSETAMVRGRNSWNGLATEMVLSWDVPS